MGEASGDRDLIGVEEVARRLGLVEATVWRWCREGRLPCIKMGRSWRVRPEALEEFIRRSERQVTLEGELGSFLRVPDNILAIARSPELSSRLERAYLKISEARDGSLVKFYRDEAVSEDEVRGRLKGGGLNLERLEREGRFLLRAEPSRGRAEALRQLLSEKGDSGRTLWVSFDRNGREGPETNLQGQQDLPEVTGRLVVETTVPEETVNEWTPEMLREVQARYSGTVWLSDDGLALSRVRPIPGL